MTNNIIIKDSYVGGTATNIHQSNTGFLFIFCKYGFS